MSTSEANLLTRAEQLGERLAAQRLNRNLSLRVRGQAGESHGRIMVGLPIRF